MKKLLLTLAAAVAFVGALENPAHSAWGEWSSNDHWTVRGDSDTRTCVANGVYSNGHILSLMFDNDGFHVIIAGVSAAPGSQHNVIVHASNGAAGTLPGFVSNDGQMIVFPALNEASLVALIKSRSITVRNVATYDLKGSAKAIAAAFECFRTLNSY